MPITATAVALGGLGAARSLTSALSALKTRGKEPAALTLIELDHQGNVPVARDQRRDFRFQHWPESIQDTKALAQSSTTILGGSLPIYQWTNSGERNLSFTAVFVSDMDLVEAGDRANTLLVHHADANPDIRAAVGWLRRYMHPSYATVSTGGAVSVSLTKPPKRLRLFAPNSGLGLAGGMNSGGALMASSVVVTMTQCDVTWEKFFESGFPRCVSVALAFAQVAQYNGRVQFPSDSDALYRAVSEEGAGTPTYGYRLKAPRRPQAGGT